MALLRIYCFFLLLVAFSGASNVDIRLEDEDENSAADLRLFLEKANALGIINDLQETELKNLAKEFMSSLSPPPVEEGDEEETSYREVFSEAFLRTYNQFSLLNVLYFSGALLVMGAFTLFSTLAWTKYSYGGVTFILLIPLLLTGFLGVRLWNGGAYPVLGGLLCAVSTSLVPFTVYCLQRALKWWPHDDPGFFQQFRTTVRGGWVVMEISTIFTGFVYLVVFGVRFPFLLFPVAWMMWFLSMDLAPFLPEWYRGWRGMFEARRILSVFFGLAMIVIGRLLEVWLGSDPDFGFWLYLFGLISFWFSVTFNFPDYDLYGSLYLLINIAISLTGSHLQRTTFQVFATMGVLFYMIGMFSNYIKPERSLLLWILKALSVVALFSQALRTGGSIEIVMGLACLVAFAYSYLPFSDSGFFHQSFYLVTTLGLVGCAAAFQRPLDLWLFEFPNTSWLVGLISSLSVLLYHTVLLKYHFNSQTGTWTGLLEQMFRVAMSVGISLVFVFLRQSGNAWVGGIALPLVASNLSTVRFLWLRGDREREVNIFVKILSLVILLMGVVLSLYVESNILYLVTCVVLLIFVLVQLDKWKILGCVFSVILVLLAVPLQSRFLMVIGVLYIFFYLSHLAYDTFKNSMLFSLTLIFLGLAIMYLGYLYETNETFIQNTFDQFTPRFITLVLSRPLSRDWSPLGKLDWYYHMQQREFSISSFTSCPHCWVLWPAPLMHSLSKGTVPYVATMCAVGIILLLLAMALSHFRQSFIENLDSRVMVTSMNIALSTDHDEHGLVVKLKGTKPTELSSVLHVAMNVSGKSFWRNVSNVFGSWKTNFARSAFLPLTLSPYLISFVGFEEGSAQFSATVLLGTGHRGSARVSHHTISETLRKLKRQSSGGVMICTLLYSSSWYAPYSKLMEKSLSLEDLSF